MTELFREIAGLCILLALAEQLMPGGALRRAGRLVMGLVLLLALVTGLNRLLSLPLPQQEAAAWSLLRQSALPARSGSYRDAALAAGARQAARLAERAAEEAGYRVQAEAALEADGQVAWVRLAWAAEAPASALGEEGPPPALKAAVAQALSIPVQRIKP